MDFSHSPFRVASARELRAAGFTRTQLERALAKGELRRVGRGVFAWGEPLASSGGGQRAAWCGEAARHLALAGTDAMLARASAAMVRALDGWGDGPLPVELNVARRSTGRRRVPARRVDVLEPPDVVDGLPVTGIGQTLVELGSTITADVLAPVDRVELAVECALHRRLIGLTGVEDVLARGSARCGAAVLRAVLARRPHGAPPTESWLETRMVQLLRDGGLPDPQRQVELRDSDAFIGRVDLLLDALVVELHGAQHNDGAALDADRLRRARLEAAGYRVLEFGYRSVVQQPVHVVALVRATLDRLR